MAGHPRPWWSSRGWETDRCALRQEFGYRVYVVGYGGKGKGKGEKGEEKEGKRSG